MIPRGLLIIVAMGAFSAFSYRGGPALDPAPVAAGQATAATAAGAMLDADLSGNDAHGIFRLAGYVRLLKRGHVNPRPDIKVVERSPATALVDGDNGMGHLVMTYAANLAVEIAREAGVAWVGVRRSNHSGAGSTYATIPLAHGMVGIYSAVSASNFMAPWGGAEPLLGTNPIAVATPGARRLETFLSRAAVEPRVPLMDLLFFLGLALVLGFKHSYDADHLVAVSNLLVRSHDLRRTVLMSVSWAAGHMLTASGIKVILFVFRESLLRGFLAAFEIIVGVMLVVIGVIGILWEFRVLQRVGLLHEHPHEHPAGEHAHPHFHLSRFGDHGTMFGIGVVHGLASNDELLILLVASFAIATIEGLVAGVVVFSFGVILGMILFGVGLNYPMLKWGDAKVRRVVSIVAAALSIAYGVLLLLGVEGINLIPIGG